MNKIGSYSRSKLEAIIRHFITNNDSTVYLCSGGNPINPMPIDMITQAGFVCIVTIDCAGGETAYIIPEGITLTVVEGSVVSFVPC